MAIKKNLTPKKFIWDNNENGVVPNLTDVINKNWAINNENKENIKEPKTPDKVFFGLISLNFLHLNIFPKTYPPISEHTQRIITHKRI